MGEKSAWRGEWENAISGKQMDNVRKDIHVVSVTNPHLETDAREDEKNNRPLQRLKRRHRLTGRYPPKVQAVKVKAFLGREAEYHAMIFIEESVRVRLVTCGTLPCVAITSLNPDVRMLKNVNSDMLRLMAGLAKSRRKNGGKGSVLFLNEGISTIRLCISRFLSEKTYSTERKKIGTKSHRQILQGNVALHQNSGK